MDKPQLLGYLPEELAALFKEQGQPAFRAEQVFSWLHRGAGYAEMSNLPKALRDWLTEHTIAQPVSILQTHVSQLDGTVKFLFGMTDGNCVEGVLMRYHHGHTLCISTQVGCRMGCAFCASTLGGCIRSLTAAEMLGQIQCANRYLSGEGRVHNIVLMGSGEPLDNYENVMRLFRLVNHEKGLNISLRSVSLSTCGLADKIRDLAEEGFPVTLSISLHAPNDEIRKRTMPVAKAYPMDALLAACRYYIEKTGRRVIFEYALIDGVNAETAHAEELASKLRGMQCHVNVIPLNPVAERDLKGVSEGRIEAFLQTLTRKHISATRRREMGDDIQGACGQLRRKTLNIG